MSWLDDLEKWAAKPGALPRRSFIGWVAKSSVAVAGTIAGISALAKSAQAGNYYCCELAYPNNWCTSYNDQGYCAIGGCHESNAYEWTCFYGNCQWICGECYDCSCSFAIRLLVPWLWTMRARGAFGR